MNREKKIIQVSLVGVLGNIGLVVVKALIGIVAGAASLISDAINNLTDALSSILTIIGTKLSGKKPDRKHPYGYGRIEYMTSVVIAALILFAGGTAVYESVVSLIRGDKSSYDNAALIAISIAILVKVGLGLFFRNRGKKYESEPLKDSGMDALLDSLLSLSTLVAALLSRFASVYLEGYFGIAIGLFILKSGFSAMKKSLSPILGDRIDDERAREIKAEICGHPEVKGAYDLVIHNYGPNQLIGSVHVEVDEDLTAAEIQVVEREIQAYAYQKFNIILTVGVYAANNKHPKIAPIRKDLAELMKENPNVLQYHGLYVEEENKTISFDLVVSFDLKNEEEFQKEVVARFEKSYPDYVINVIIDHDFSA